MKIALRSIIEAGDARRERITLRVNEPADIGDFMLTRNYQVGDEVAIGVLNTFWFPYSLVDKGDLIILYTRSGESKTKPLENGSRAHFFFWGIDKPIWASDDTSPVLMHIPEWTTAPTATLRKTIK
jgi:hypothetical protein